MSNHSTGSVPVCTPLDSAKRVADELCDTLSGLAGIVRSGTELPAGDGRERIARFLVGWRRDTLPTLESLLSAFEAALEPIHNDVIEARNGERFSLGWRKGESAFDVLRQISMDVVARFHDCPAAVDVGSRVFCEQLQLSLRLTADEIDAMKDEINRDFAHARQQGRRTIISTTPQPQSDTAIITPPKTSTRPKRSTERGEGRAKLISALTKHHGYAEGSCLNVEPIGNNELAKLAKVAPSTASGFFDHAFKGLKKYRALCLDLGKLVAALKLLNGEFSPHNLYGHKPHDEDDREDE